MLLCVVIFILIHVGTHLAIINACICICNPSISPASVILPLQECSLQNAPCRPDRLAAEIVCFRVFRYVSRESVRAATDHKPVLPVASPGRSCLLSVPSRVLSIALRAIGLPRNVHCERF